MTMVKRQYLNVYVNIFLKSLVKFIILNLIKNYVLFFLRTSKPYFYIKYYVGT